jgi:two-component system sensor histidine kinase AgrC
MENYMILTFGTFISCMINIIILFQFIEERNERKFNNRFYYKLLKIAVYLLVVMINELGKPVLNIVSWIVLFSFIDNILYRNNNKKLIYRIFEIPVLILILSVCETVGVEMLEYILLRFHIRDIQPIMIKSMEITFSKLVVLIFYYLVITKLWREEFAVKYTITQCLIQIIIILFSMANLAVIIVVISKVTSKTEHILILINIGCILFADLYFLYLARFVEENNQLKVKLRLLEQQSLLQFEFYEEQKEKYNESIKILHDVDKHLNMIEVMYQASEHKTALTYAQEIGKMLMPLSLEDYTNNPILNVILNDKKKIANYHKIKFNLEIGIVDLSFMEPIEVTTIFGNLLDNAIDACDMVPQDRFIIIKLDKYNDFTVINITNSTIPIDKWHHGKPVSKKGKNHGIGLLNVENVIKKYNGSMVLEEANNIFSCKIIFN